MSLDERNLLIIADGVPGKVSFDNFAEVKGFLEAGLADYSGLIYTEADLASAESDRKTLKAVKKKLEDKKKEIKAAYSKPYVKVEAQIDELIGMVKEPLDIVEKFIKETEKAIKLQEVKAYAEERAKALGDYSEKVLNSPSFFNERWLNSTYKAKDWHADIDSIIAKASDDIQTIQAVGGKNTGAMLAHYFDRLSMDGISFLYVLKHNS